MSEGSVLYMAFVYAGFYCNMYMEGGYWYFEVINSSNEEGIFSGQVALGDASIGEMVEGVMKKIDALSSRNYA